VEKLKAEVRQLRQQCEELSESKADAMRELSELKERFQLELSDEHIADLIDNTNNGESMDRRLTELRTEVSHLHYISIINSFSSFVLQESTYDSYVDLRDEIAL